MMIMYCIKLISERDEFRWRENEFVVPVRHLAFRAVLGLFGAGKELSMLKASGIWGRETCENGEIIQVEGPPLQTGVQGEGGNTFKEEGRKLADGGATESRSRKGFSEEKNIAESHGDSN